MDREPGAAGGDNPGALSPEMARAVNDEINRALTAYMKREAPKLFKAAIAEAIPEIGQQVFGQIQEALPSDEELAQYDAGDGGDPNADPNGEYRIPPALNAELLELRKYRQTSDERLAQLEREREESAGRAEASDRQASIQGLLNKYTFANDASREIAFNYFMNRAERDETGELIANGLPVGKFIEENMGNLTGLLASRPVGGAGSTPGGRAKAGPQLEDIRPGMGAADEKAAWAAAVAALPADVSGVRQS